MKSISTVNRRLSFLIATIIAIAFVSCNKDESSIGTAIMPSSDMMEFLCDTMSVETFVVRDVNVETQNRSINPIGIINDPIFGQTTASCIFQPLLSSTNVQFSKEIDTTDLSGVKLTIHLKYLNIYGDKQSTMNINVNRLLTDISFDSTYYENKHIDASQYENLVSTALTFGDDSIAKIELPQSLVQEIIRKNANSQTWTNNDFIKFLKGFYVTTEIGSGNGCMYALNLVDPRSKMVLTYNDTCTFNFDISEYSARINLYEHDYTNADSELQSAINNPNIPTKYCYVQGLAGLKTKIKFPELKNLFDSTNIIINRAQMKITIKENSQSNEIPCPKGMSMTKILNNGLFDFLDDYKSNSKLFGGSYDEADKSYTFNIPLHLQSLQKGEPDNGIFLVANDNRITPYRAMLYGGAHEISEIKVIVYYSKY